jgi:predicted dehydrogenase
MPTKIHRREMLRRTAAAGIGAWLARPVSAAAEGKSPNEKLDVAVVGCGGQGGENLRQVAEAGENIVALCDVDDRSAAQAFKAFPGAKKYRDWRKMLDEMHREIDAVLVSIPDHMHAPVSLAALRLGKHVYCEKPLTWSIEEARLMAQAAREAKVATQMGTQGMAGDSSRAGIEMIRSGVLGEVTEMHVWTDRAEGWWPQGVGRPAEKPPVPKELDWDLWLGGAPERPYHSAYCPFRWRGWKDFGTGAVGDMGIHNAAMPWMALKLGRPRSAELVSSSGLVDETFPAWSIIKCEFAASGDRGPVSMYWYDGGKRPPAKLIFGAELAKNGAIVVGKKATLYSIEWTGGDWHLLPEAGFKDTKPPAANVPRAPGQSHHREWIQAAKGGRPSFCNFPDFASEITETMLVANLAIRTGKKIEWSAGEMKATGCPEADPFIRREYRAGWKV